MIESLISKVVGTANDRKIKQYKKRIKKHPICLNPKYKAMSRWMRLKKPPFNQP